MDFLEFVDVSFLANTNIGPLCVNLNTIVGDVIWYNWFQIRNSNWLWLVNYIVAAINTNN